MNEYEDIIIKRLKGISSNQERNQSYAYVKKLNFSRKLNLITKLSNAAFQVLIS
jgi:hypothetical protein